MQLYDQNVPNQCLIAAVIPAHNEEKHISAVLEEIPECVHIVIVVDDGSTDNTADMARNLQLKDERIILIQHESNQGVGAAVISGYKKALHLNADIVVKIDADGQMSPHEIPRLVMPIIAGMADYTKGHRFHDPRNVKQMPHLRLYGNLALSFLTKAVSGYWHIFDPTCGFTAIHRHTLASLPLDEIKRDYFFETDMLITLYRLQAVVCDVPVSNTYADEQSDLSIPKVLTTFPKRFLRALLSRIIDRYFLTDFTPVSLFLILGIPLCIFGLLFGAIHWLNNAMHGMTTPAGTVMIAVTTLFFGFQFLLQALVLDMGASPRIPLQTLQPASRCTNNPPHEE